MQLSGGDEKVSAGGIANVARKIFLFYSTLGKRIKGGCGHASERATVKANRTR